MFTELYAEMAEDAYLRYLSELENRIPIPSFDDDPTARVEQDNALVKSGVQAIVFTTMALESGIFDLAAINLGDELAGGYLDKLTLEGKWQAIPELVCGRSLRINGPALNNLKSLIRARNRLVHYKSKPIPFGDDAELLMAALKAAEKTMKQFDQDVLLSFKTLVLLSIELDELIGCSSSLPDFSKGYQESCRNSKKSKIYKIIEGCWEVHRRFFR